MSAAAGVDGEVDPTADPFDFDETDDFGVPIPEITDPTNEGGATGDSGEVAAKKKPRRWNMLFECGFIIFTFH